LAFGAALVLVGAGVGIGHAAWQSPTHLSAAPSSNSSGSSGSGSNANPNGGFQSPFGGNNGNNGGNVGGGFGSGGSSSSIGAGPSDAASIASQVDPGLVDINTSLGYQGEQAAGTGIVLTSTGEILTNNHVIEGATTISVTDVGNHKTYSAQVVGYDRSKDIAVLQLHGASGLQTANLGNSSKLAVGQQVVGIGNAGGTGGTPSYAGGTVTALNQSITASDQNSTSEQLTGLIQTNASIQAGDSGGSLVNTSGQVIGIDTAASAGFSFQSSGGEGFAIPINTATSIAKQIEAGNSSSTVHIGETAFLGVEIESQAAANGGGGGGGPFGSANGSGNQSQGSGAVVAGVVTSSPAQEAGLAQGDVITTVNGTSVTSPDGVTAALEQDHPGDKVTIGWTDPSGNSNTATVQLTSGPPQ
jgi:S1-C subfamily serine protease